MTQIFFFSEDTPFQLENPEDIQSWILDVIEKENHSLASLNYIFCSDEYLLEINRSYLEHDYYTDIITFNQSEDAYKIEGDIYISVDRVKENASSFSKEFLSELHRVMIHGVLHLLGYDDKTDIQKEQMRKKEEACLSLQRF